MRRLTTDEFIAKAREIHGDANDYSESEYRNNRTEVKIKCLKHDYVYTQRPIDHLQGCGCPLCWNERRKKGVIGVGIMDMDNESHTDCARIWRNMITRCYSPKEHAKHPTYEKCTVCEEWLLYSNFKRWFEDPANGYRKGCDLDKDVFGSDCKVYSPETCCFIPAVINKLIITDNRKKGSLPTGVRKQPYGFQAFLSINGHPTYLGHRKTSLEASKLYQSAKARHIADTALEYYTQGEITEKVYNGLLRYSQSLTDKLNK